MAANSQMFFKVSGLRVAYKGCSPKCVYATNLPARKLALQAGAQRHRDFNLSRLSQDKLKNHHFRKIPFNEQSLPV